MKIIVGLSTGEVIEFNGVVKSRYCCRFVSKHIKYHRTMYGEAVRVVYFRKVA